MKAQRFNKTTAAALAGAAVTVIGSVWTLDPQVMGSLQTLITAGLVYLIANKG